MKAVLDTNVFLRGSSTPSYEQKFTVPEVEEEVKSSMSQRRFEASDVLIEEASEQSQRKVSEKSKDINAATSDTDEKLLALALEKEAVLITDDKDLQNLALHLGVDFDSYIGDKIDRKLEWVEVCHNCGSEVEKDSCPRCGSSDTVRKLRD